MFLEETPHQLRAFTLPFTIFLSFTFMLCVRGARLAWVLTLTLTLTLPLTLTLTLTNPHPNPIFKKMYVFSPICTPYICGAPPRVSLGMRAYPVVCLRERAGSP